MTTSPDLAALLERLRTHDVGPDREDAPVAVDPADRLLLDEAAPLLAGVAPGAVAVVDDRYGALTLGAALLTGAGPAGEAGSATGGRVRVHQDACTAEAALDANARAVGMATAYGRHGLDAGLLAGARVVLLRLPRGLAALRDVAEHVAREAGPDVVLLGSARVKHMTRAMNDVLAESFGEVRASLARGKSRVLVASAPRPARSLTYPVVTDLADVGLRVAAFGAAFAGASLDLGTRSLLDRLGADDRSTPGAQGAAPRDVVDL
ncbi:hypothetical protein G8C93_18820, partial [Cellulosimicrobium cellulans]|nr:hypothetical protein [Cellulosimicrobium cellulans]